jgi:putative FmdB family regulatory protein
VQLSSIDLETGDWAMPLFEYKCQDCEKVEEFLQKYSDPAPETCPGCGAEGALHKVVSLSSFQLKGGGWYKDLYSSVPEGKDGGDSSKAEPAAAKTSDASTPAAKSKDSSAASKPAADSKKPAEKPAKKPAASKKVSQNAA